MFPFPFPLSAETICLKRGDIYTKITTLYPQLKDRPIPALPEALCGLLLGYYDDAFFHGMIKRMLPQLTIHPSSRMTRCGGKFVILRSRDMTTTCQIRMSTDFLLRLTDGPFLVDGLSVSSAIEAFMLVLEHELCHAAEYALYGHVNAHQAVFRSLCQGLFGHTSITHQLPTRAQQAITGNISVGTYVSFMHKNITLRGIVSRITKRATVMVKDPKGIYIDSRRIRYSRYLVPLSKLTVVHETI